MTIDREFLDNEEKLRRWIVEETFMGTVLKSEQRLHRSELNTTQNHIKYRHRFYPGPRVEV